MKLNNEYFNKCKHGKWDKDCSYCWKNDQMDKKVCPECGSRKVRETHNFFMLPFGTIFYCEACGFTATS